MQRASWAWCIGLAMCAMAGGATHDANRSVPNDSLPARGSPHFVTRDVSRDGVPLGIGEHLRATAAGTEQSWSLATKPGGSGDLVVRVDAAGARFTGRDAHGLHFVSAAGDARIAYGNATWIDARGVRRDVPATYESGAITLRVAARDVEEATYPAVLDPTIGPELDITNPVYFAPSSQNTSARAAYDGTNVYAVQSNLGLRINASTGRPLASDVTGYTLGTPNTAVGADEEPMDVAFDGTYFDVVWLTGTSTAPVLKMARVDPATGQPIASDVGGKTIETPAAAGQLRLVFDGTNLLLVWQDTSTSLKGAYFVPSTLAAVGTSFAIGTCSSQPSIEMAVGPSGTTEVVWIGTNSVLAARVDVADGGVKPADTNGIALPSNGAFYPGVTYDGTNYVVVWEDSRSGNRDIYGARILASSGRVVAADTSGRALFVASGSQDEPAIGFDGTYSIVVWLDDTSKTMVGARYDSTTGLLVPADASGITIVPANYVPHLISAGSVLYATYINASFYYQSYGVRIGQDAHALSADTGGVRLSSVTSTMSEPAIASDGTNYLVAWQDTRTGTTTPSLYAARVDANGDVLAADAAGIAIGSSVLTSAPAALAFDGTNYLVTWITATGGVSGARVGASSGAVLASDVGGKSLYGYSEAWIDTVFDGTNYQVFEANNPIFEGLLGVVYPSGALSETYPNGLISYSSYPKGPYGMAYASPHGMLVYETDAARAPAIGAKLFLGTGPLQTLTVSTNDFAKTSPAIATDGTIFFVVWADFRNDAIDGDIYGARFDANGVRLDTNDIAIAIATGDQSEPHITSTGDGATFQVVWRDLRTGTPAIYGALVGNDGRVRDPDGVAISTDGSEDAPVIAGQRGASLLAYTTLDDGPLYHSQRVRVRAIPVGASSGTCTSNLDCASRYCADGYCCNAACNGACQTCSATPGTCTSVTNADDPDTCAATCAASATSCQAQSSCNASGVCSLASGQLASTASACLSGFLAGGVCCDQACTGGCATCTAPGHVGTCTPLVAGSNGVNGACVATGVDCDGVTLDCPVTCHADHDCPSGEFCNAKKSCQTQISKGACDLTADCAEPGCNECGDGTTCAGSTCDADAGTSSVVALASGAGTCQPTVNLETTSCGGFGCKANACATTCKTKADCASGFQCDTAGACIQAATCSDPHTAQDATGATTDCTPYVCAAGACEKSCSSIADCVGGYVCGANSTCVLATAASAAAGNPASNGCSCRTAQPKHDPRTTPMLAGVGILGLVVSLRRRKRRG